MKLGILFPGGTRGPPAAEQGKRSFPFLFHFMFHTPDTRRGHRKHLYRPEGRCLPSATKQHDRGFRLQIFLYWGAALRFPHTQSWVWLLTTKTWAKNRPRIGSKSHVEGCKSRRINNKLVRLTAWAHNPKVSDSHPVAETAWLRLARCAAECAYASSRCAPIRAFSILQQSAFVRAWLWVSD